MIVSSAEGNHLAHKIITQMHLDAAAVYANAVARCVELSDMGAAQVALLSVRDSFPLTPVEWSTILESLRELEPSILSSEMRMAL